MRALLSLAPQVVLLVVVVGWTGIVLLLVKVILQRLFQSIQSIAFLRGGILRLVQHQGVDLLFDVLLSNWRLGTTVAWVVATSTVGTSRLEQVLSHLVVNDKGLRHLLRFIWLWSNGHPLVLLIVSGVFYALAATEQDLVRRDSVGPSVTSD